MAKNATFYLDEHVLLKAKEVVDEGLFKSLNAFVESAIKAKLEQIHDEKIRQEIIDASQDPMFLADIAEIEQDFKHVDFEKV